MRVIPLGMRTVLLAAVALLLCGLADPVLAARIRKARSTTRAGDEQLLVTFKRVGGERFNVKRSGHKIARENARDFIRILDRAAEVTEAYSMGEMTTYLVRGRPGLLRKLKGRPDVEIAEVDGAVNISEASLEQLGTTWGLERITQPDSTLAKAQFDYHYPESAGEGVDIYVIDTGIQPDLEEFEGRACNGFSAFGPVSTYRCGVSSPGGPALGYGIDENGHGTHIAGTCAGRTYGVAKAASIIGVQVLDNAGAGTLSGVIAGVQYAIAAHVAKRGAGTGSVINMSLGGGYSPTLNSVVAKAVKLGIVVAVAAGNSGMDAGGVSPASEPTVLTVGAATDSDSKAWFSNYGNSVNVWAPGFRVTSVNRFGSPVSPSGTSYACPHVSGVAALLLGRTDGFVRGKTAFQIQEYMKSTAVDMKNYSEYNAKMIYNGCSDRGCFA